MTKGRLLILVMLLVFVEGQTPQLSRVAFRHNALGLQVRQPRENPPTLFTSAVTVDTPPAVVPQNDLYMIGSVTLLISGLVVALLFFCHKLTIPKPNFH